MNPDRIAWNLFLSITLTCALLLVLTGIGALIDLAQRSASNGGLVFSFGLTALVIFIALTINGARDAS